MITYFSPQHTRHAPAYEFFRGKQVPCFESPARAAFVHQALQASGHELREPNEDSSAVLAQIHSPRYLAFLQTAWQQWLDMDASNSNVQPFPSVWPVRTLRSDVEPANFVAKLGLYSMDNGSPMVAGTWAAAKAGADAACSAATLLYTDKSVPAAFCATRPPGHHAGADFMGGYCFINNAAIAAQTFLNHGCRRVAILDVDYHHGNGTQSIFYERADVFFASIHGDPRTEYPFYLGHADEVGEGTGEGGGQGYNLNLPLPAGSDAAAWFTALDTACDRIASYQAEAIVISLGLDTFAGDPISTFALQTADYARLGQRLRQLGLSLSHGRPSGAPTLFVLEGGYAAAELGTNAMQVLAGFEGG